VDPEDGLNWLLKKKCKFGLHEVYNNFLLILESRDIEEEHERIYISVTQRKIVIMIGTFVSETFEGTKLTTTATYTGKWYGLEYGYFIGSIYNEEFLIFSDSSPNFTYFENKSVPRTIFALE